MRTEANRLFDEFNRRYWRGRLPTYRVIRRAVILGRCLGLCSNDSRTILLRRELQGELLRLVLLHEMCHIGTGSGHDHGPRFVRKLCRLARLGEPNLLKDIERYDGTAVNRTIAKLAAAGKLASDIPFRSAVSDDIEAVASALPFLRTWSKVRGWLADKYHLSPSQFDRAAPWAEREWRRVSGEYRSIRHDNKRFRAVEKGG